MKDRATITYDPGELAALTEEGAYPLDLPHDADGIDVMILHAGGVQGFPKDQLIAQYTIKRIAVDTGRDLSRRIKVLAEMGVRELDVTLFPRHAVVERDQ